MRSGDFRHRVTLQARSTAQDALGGQMQSWVDIGTVWASVVPLSGRELLVAGANQSEVTELVTIRYQSRLSDPKAMAAMRIVYGTRILNIHAAIDVDERHQSIELSCSSGLNNG